MEIVALYLAVGAAAGVLAGLFGIGGGLVVVPALLFTLPSAGIPPASTAHVALGTSLATIIATSAASTRSHDARGNVDWGVVRPLAVGVVTGTALGGAVAARLSDAVLELLLSLFLAGVAARMLLDWRPRAAARPPGRAATVGAGGAIGFASALFGIGGGTLTVPFLAWLGLPMQRAIGTSAACGVPIAVTGSLAYVVSGWRAEGLPLGSLGFVYLPAALAIAAASAATTRLGVALGARLSELHLRRAFAALLLLTAARLALW